MSLLRFPMLTLFDMFSADEMHVLALENKH